MDRDKRVLDSYSGYDKLQDIFQAALRRAAVGKGAIRHAEENQPFERQQICDDLRGTDKSAAIFQIRKKAREVLRLSRRQDKVNELLDVCVYAAAAVLVLIEEQQELDNRKKEIKDERKATELS